MFVDLFTIGLLFFQLVFNFFHLLLLYDVGLVQFSDLFLFFVDGLDLLLGFLGQLLEFFLHATYFVGRLTVFIVLECFFLSFPNFFKGLFFFFECLELSLEMLELIFLLYYFIDVIFAIEIPSKFGNFSLILLDSYLLFFQFLLELHDTFILFTLPCILFLLLPLALLLNNLIHFGGKFLELPLELDMLLNKFSLPSLRDIYALFSAMGKLK